MFVIPGNLFQGVSAFGAPPPASGYYAVRIMQVEQNKDDKAEVRRLHVRFPDGFTKLEFIHLAYEQNAQGQWVPIAGLTEKQVSGRMGAIRTVLESLGYSQADIESPQAQVNPAWFVYSAQNPREAFVEWVGPQAGVKDSYGEVQGWLKRADFDVRKALGQAPVRLERGGAAASGTQPGPVGSAAYAPPPQQGGGANPGYNAPPPSNGVAAGAPVTGAPSLPPPPPPPAR